MKSNYEKIGDHIREVNIRNKDLQVNTLLGINIDKYYMPSVANIIGTDLTSYKIVEKGQFACNRMHVGRDYRLPVALSKEEKDIIVSPAYDVFEIINEKVLLPEYLMMWFSRKEFDRNAWFYTDADVRGGLPWKSFCEMEIPVPDIEKQKEIVEEYNAIVNRIELNNKLIQKLEETAQAIYKRWFVDFEFPDKEGKPYKSNGGEMVFNEELEKEIPIDWDCICIKDFCSSTKSGGTPSRDKPDYWNSKDFPWLKTGEISNNIIIGTEEYISSKGLNESSAKLLPKDTVLMSMYGANAGDIGILKIESTTNQACCGMICKNQFHSAYLYFHLLHNQKFISSQSIGGAQENLSKDYIDKIPILNPSEGLIEDSKQFVFIERKERITREIFLLEQLLNLILSKLSSSNNSR